MRERKPERPEPPRLAEELVEDRSRECPAPRKSYRSRAAQRSRNLRHRHRRRRRRRCHLRRCSN